MKICPACGTEYDDHAAFCSRDRSALRPKEGGGGLTGQVLGERYRIDRKLGEGGMSEVYLAHHVLMGRPSAVKILGGQLTRDPDAVGRFNREATNASRINHPNVCAIYDFGLTPDGLIYLAMEYVEGGTLTALLDRTGPLPVSRAIEIIKQCAAGLQAAHDLGIIHRDLKPDNIMANQGRSGDLVKLVDFGIAKAIDAEREQQVTRTGLVVGTPEYMSPEQLSGDAIDARSDVYSLALVFYRMVTGTLPFQATTAQETMAKRLTEDPLPLAQALPTGIFPPGLQQVLDRGLARYPRDRCPSAPEFATGLEQATIRSETRDHTIPKTLVTPMRPSRRKLWPLVGVGVLATIGAGYFLWPSHPRIAGIAKPDSGVVQYSKTDTTTRSADPTHVALKDLALRERSPGPRVPPVSTSAPTAAPIIKENHSSDSALAQSTTDPSIPSDELPHDSLISSSDPAKREHARLRANAFFQRGGNPAKRRAEAAYMLAMAALDRNELRKARNWLERCLGLAELPRCRKLLNEMSK